MRDPAIEEIYQYFPPQKKFIGVLCLPHSGEQIPDEFKSYLVDDNRALIEDVDFRVHDLIDINQLQISGIGVLKSNISRVCVDLNRSPKNCVLYWTRNTQGIKLVTQTPELSFVDLVTARYYSSYFEMLRSLIQHLERESGALVSAIDLHSMPSKPTAYHLAKNDKQSSDRPDFCLSDLHGSSCQKSYIDMFSALLARDYSVAINSPYFGGYGTQYMQQYHTNVMQVEINRGIYMDEVSKCLIDVKVSKLKPILTQAIIDLYQHFAV
jgi:N-formylglutamate amidohydrolase